MKKEHITMERSLSATLDEVWELWTTKDGIESWWGPHGFRVEVRVLDVRPGGTMLYDMIADTPETRTYMKAAGMPGRHEARITFREVRPRERLAYTHLADFIPGVAAYDVETVVTFASVGPKVRLVLEFDRMHDEPWTRRATEGWTMELAKLEARLSVMNHERKDA